MSKIKPKGRKHENCPTCDMYPLFNLDEELFIHGCSYTKEQILMWKEFYETFDEVMKCEIDRVDKFIGDYLGV